MRPGAGKGRWGRGGGADEVFADLASFSTSRVGLHRHPACLFHLSLTPTDSMQERGVSQSTPLLTPPRASISVQDLLDGLSREFCQSPPPHRSLFVLQHSLLLSIKLSRVHCCSSGLCTEKCLEPRIRLRESIGAHLYDFSKPKPLY